MSNAIQAPDGRTWVVQRCWAPRLGGESVWGRFHRRFRQTMRRSSDLANADPGCMEVIGEGIVAAVMIIVVVLAIIFIGLPLLVAVFDLALVLALTLLGLIARVVFRRPWTIEARSSDGTVAVWRVVGWRASGLRMAEIEQLFAAGIVPPPDSPGVAAV